jgi:hypothetical protein
MKTSDFLGGSTAVVRLLAFAAPYVIKLFQPFGNKMKQIILSILLSVILSFITYYSPKNPWLIVYLFILCFSCKQK